MNKAEAQQAMREGKKVTHRFFEDHEWSVGSGWRAALVKSEDGVEIESREWWFLHNAPGFDIDWTLFEEKKKAASNTDLEAENKLLHIQNEDLKEKLKEASKEIDELKEVALKYAAETNV